MDPTERLPTEILRKIIWNLPKSYHQGIIHSTQRGLVRCVSTQRGLVRCVSTQRGLVRCVSTGRGLVRCHVDGLCLSACQRH
ncbi:Cytochrome P450 monooxygenase tenA, partial [Fusarium oxysporum f. sp. albedinis]